MKLPHFRLDLQWMSYLINFTSSSFNDPIISDIFIYKRYSYNAAKLFVDTAFVEKF